MRLLVLINLFGEWDNSNVIKIYDMFYEATSFNQDISRWNVSKVTNMSNMSNMSNMFRCSGITNSSNSSIIYDNWIQYDNINEKI